MLGWGISLMVHALAVAWLWHAWLPRHADTDAGPVRRIEVRLVSIVPKTTVPKVSVPPSSPVQTRAAPRAAAPQRQGRTSAISSSPTAAVPEPSDEAVNVIGSGSGSVTEAPTVDLAAARTTARLIARESGKGLVALPGRKPVVDPNADHRVVDRLERARRIDCQTARAGSTNLLANVVMLAVDLAKNAVDDSGCKW
jgi:hypothetical protein